MRLLYYNLQVQVYSDLSTTSHTYYALIYVYVHILHQDQLFSTLKLTNLVMLTNVGSYLCAGVSNPRNFASSMKAQTLS